MNNWISVKDRLPEYMESILAFGNGTIYVCWYDTCKWIYSDCCGCSADIITHWMPLPEPPKDE